MTDDIQTATSETNAPVQDVKTATDLKLEQIEARIDELIKENKELREANTGLWAQLHPAQEPPVLDRHTVVRQPAPEQPDTDADMDAINKAFGWE